MDQLAPEAANNVIKFVSVDLDFMPNCQSRLEEFLSINRTELRLDGKSDLISAWLTRVWPSGKSGTMIVAKLPPEEGSHFWMIRPAFSGDADTERESPIAVGSQIPAFRVRIKDGKLLADRFEVDTHQAPGPYEVCVAGEFHIPVPWRGGMRQAELDALQQIPVFAPPAGSRFADWRIYLDWREKVTEDNSKHPYPYSEWELSHNRETVRFYLSKPQSVDLLKMRFQGQQLIALEQGSDYDGVEAFKAKSKRIVPAGVFQNVIPPKHSRARQRGDGKWRYQTAKTQEGLAKSDLELVEVELRLSKDQREKLGNNEEAELFPEPGELRVDVEGELSILRNQRQAIGRLEQGKTVSPHVQEWLFNSRKARTGEDATQVEIIDTRFNTDQRESVVNAMQASDAFFLQGPPGTGKTTVIAELCRQMVKSHKRTLIASQANLAVDNALGSLSPKRRPSPELRPLRVINDRREGEMEDQFKCFLKRNVVPHWLNTVAAACEMELANTPKPNGLDEWHNLKQRWTARLSGDSPADNSEEMQKLYVRRANVIGVTCNRAGTKDFYQSQELDPNFDLVIVDEVSKATPPELLMPLLLGRRAVLVGDHRQLPPVFREDSFYEAEIGRAHV